MELVTNLNYAGNEAARDYLNGQIDPRAAAAWLVNYALMSPERAAQRTRFFDQYRSYVDQLQPRAGPGEAVHRVEGRDLRSSAAAMA